MRRIFPHGISRGGMAGWYRMYIYYAKNTSEYMDTVHDICFGDMHTFHNFCRKPWILGMTCCKASRIKVQQVIEAEGETQGRKKEAVWQTAPFGNLKLIGAF